MQLRELLSPWMKLSQDVLIEALYQDSRLVTPGGLFMAYPGSEADGRYYLDAVADKGAVAILYEPDHMPPQVDLPSTMVCIPFPNLSKRVGEIASRFYHTPTQSLYVTGITGTNGKTSIAYQLTMAYQALSTPAWYVGTLGYGHQLPFTPLVNTTPDALGLQRICHEAVRAGISALSLEVSSHALVQGRVSGVVFQQAIFTNLTQDHLDYHKTMAAYGDAKAELFAYPSLKWAILNQDDPAKPLMTKHIAKTCEQLTYGLSEGCDVRASDWQLSENGTSFTIDSPWGQHHFAAKLLGLFNIYNALAVFSSLVAAGHPPADVVNVMASLPSAPGRLECLSTDPCVIVDYAHTPDALLQALTTLRAIAQPTSRVIVVCGCGGDRDKAKRPLMGAVAARLADVVILTSDNPRSEDPLDILSDMQTGVAFKPGALKVIPCRKTAIQVAFQAASLRDIILVAGKGHEHYQEIQGVRHPFSDHAVIHACLAER